MESLSVYHGDIGKEEGERRLCYSGKDGSYLVRNSDSVPGVYCLCVLCTGSVYTYRIFLDESGSWTADTAPGVEKRFFRKIKNLIAAFQHPDQGIVMPLMYPVTAQARANTHTYTHSPSGNTLTALSKPIQTTVQGQKNRSSGKHAQKAAP
ncbi:SH2 domain-containing protein 1A-like [Hypomesus transpacificus]|uniref:SH2 domain-containing protein 1A-like n=1 Tax=Hypomesus transpacificus TaxID=137520 RepID=UPI001F084A28|nr:SH2 domain-containing protein 1A-like [Hypomesus transpacificus]